MQRSTTLIQKSLNFTMIINLRYQFVIEAVLEATKERGWQRISQTKGNELRHLITIEVR